MTRHRELAIAATLGALLALAGPAGTAAAHHSYALYDTTRKVQITGVVTAWEWTNPHAHMEVLTTDAAGVGQSWNLTMSSPNILLRTGWSPKSVKVGDRVTVVLNPRRDGVPGGTPLTVTTADGHVLGEAEAAPAGPERQ